MFVMDTSGSMDSEDYDQVKCGMTGEMTEYKNYETTSDTPKVWLRLYSGTSLSNTTSQRILNDSKIVVNQRTGKEIYNDVSEIVDGVEKYPWSESMLTCLLYAIDNTRKKRFPTPLLKATNMRSACFVLFTDETIWTNESLWYATYLYKNKNSEYYSDWLGDWDEKTGGCIENMMLDHPSNETGFCEKLNAGLK